MKKFFILFLFITFLFPGIVYSADITSKEQLNQHGITIGVSQGSVIENFIKREFPNASIAYFTDGGVLGYQAAAAGKIDAYIADRRQMELSIESGFSGVHLLKENMNETLKTAIGISQVSKIPDLEEKINEFLSELRADGTLKEMFQRWVIDGNEQMPEIELDDDPKYHLIVGTAGIVPPYSYYKDTKLNGHDIELAYRLADWLDADVEFKVIDFTGLVPAAMSGKIDCIISDLQVSEERQENFTFSTPVMEERVGIMVRGDAPKVPELNMGSTADFSVLDGKTIGVITGFFGDQEIKKALPNTKIFYFVNKTDMLSALKAGKIDALLWDDAIFRYLRMEGEPLAAFSDPLMPINNAALFPKNDKGLALEAQYSEFVKKLWDDGTIDTINAVWFGSDESQKTVINYENLPDTNGTLVMAADPSVVPFVYMKDNRIVGYEVDIAARFCEANGYRLKIQTTSFGSIIPAVMSGKADFSSSSMTITPERAESVQFSEPVYRGNLVFTVLSEKTEDKQKNETDFVQYDGKRIGVVTGSTGGPAIEENLPNAKISYFNSVSDMLTALQSQKVDAIAATESILKFVRMEGEKISLTNDHIISTEIAALFPKTEKGQKLETQYSEFVKKLWDDGTIDEINSIWFGEDESKKTVLDYENLPETNGTLTMAVDTGNVPFVYLKDGEIVGYDVDVAARFCEAYGYRLTIQNMSFPAIIPSVVSGKSDFSACDIAITPERAESVLFSEPTYYDGLVLATKETGENSGISDKILAMDGKRIAVLTGSFGDQEIQKKLPAAKLSYFDTITDMLSALKSDKVDAMVWDDSVVRYLITEGEPVKMLDGFLFEIENAAAFAKNEKGKALEAQYSEYVKKLWDNGTIAEIDAKWYDPDDSKKTVIDYENLPGPNGTLIMAVDPSLAPFTYVKDNRVVGYEVDIAAGFCEEYGYRLEVQTMSFGAMIPAIVSGKADFASSCLTITPERAESVLFSEPIYRGGEVAAVLAEDMAAKPVSERPSTLAQLNGKRIAVTTGSIDAQLVQNKLPEAKLSYFESTTDMLTALKSNKVDAMSWDDSMLRYLMLEGEPIVMLDEFLSDINNAAAFAKTKKGKALEAQYSEYVKKLWDNGTIAEIDAKWFDSDDSKKTVIDYENLPGPNGTLIMAVDPSLPPFTYVKDNRVVGYEIEIAAGFCEEYGYRLKVQMMSFGAMIPAIVSGKADFASSNLTITPEREESVLFSEPIYRGGIALAIKEDPTANTKVDTDSGVSDQILAMAGKRFAVVTGSICDQAVLDMLPTAKLSYFDSVADMLTALKANKVDAFVWDDSIIRFLITEGEPIQMLDGNILGIDNAAAFAKNEKGKALEAQYSEYVKKLWDNGTIAEIDAKWYDPDDSKKTVIDYENLPGPNGTLIMAVDPSLAPFTYVKDNRVVGYEVDIAAGFCEEYGYRLEVQTMSFGAMIPAIVSGKADFASSCLTITPEREESVLFSEPVYRGGEVFAVMDENDSVSISDHSADIALTLSDMDGKRIGVQTGQTFDKMVLEVLPDAEIIYVNSKADLINSLLTGKIDSYAVDEPVIKSQMRENDKISYIPEYLSTFEFGYVFPKTDEGEKLRTQFSEFIRKIRTDGTIDEIEGKWMNPDQSQWTLPDYASFPAPNGKLIMATEALYEPFTFIFNNEIVGYDIDIAARFCEAYGYGLEITDMEFSGIIPSVQSGKTDFGGAGITITAERAESVLFSEPNYSGGTVMAILKENEERTYASNPENPKIWNGVYKSLSELSGKKIGVQTGSDFDKTVQDVISDAQIVYLNNKADLVNSLLAFKIDGFVVDEPVAEILAGENSSLTYIPDYLDAFDFGYVFPRNDDGEDLCDEFSEFLEDIKSDGTLGEIEKRWFSDGESGKSIPDYKSFPAPNGTLRLAVEALYEPFCYIANNQIVGYDIDIAVRFCEANGYGLEIHDMSFDAVLPAVQTGKADFGGSGINITPERAESVLFSEPNYSGGTVVMVLREDEIEEDEIEEDEIPEFKTFSELDGKTVSMLNGAPFEELFRSKGTEAGQFTYYNNMPDAILALTSGKTDAFITNNAVARLLSNRNEELAQFPENLEETFYGFAFAKGSPERETWQTAYETIPEKTKRDLWKKWTNSDESKKVLPVQDWPGTNGTVTVAACDTLEPMSYKGKGGELIGFDEEIILLMARELDVHVNFIGMEFSVILSTVQSGKALFGAGSIMITKERAESVDFLPYYPASFVMLVRAADFAEEINTPTVSKMDTVKSEILGTWESIKASFEKTFIRENRWKLFLEGIGNTLLITVLSIIFGTILGFLLFIICRNGNSLANGITAVCTWLVQGMPGVVLLMILFYVVFGSVAIDGIIVAVIGFTLTFGSSVFGLLKIGVGAIDKGQYEAAYALGYSNTRTFFRIILPQAIPHVMGAYKGEIVGLLKATAIVGYIAVQDLTKMGDIVRSRTYEAFFPLIAVTIIYFILESILGLIVSRINIQIDPKRRKRESILKGVKTND